MNKMIDLENPPKRYPECECWVCKFSCRTGNKIPACIFKCRDGDGYHYYQLSSREMFFVLTHGCLQFDHRPMMKCMHSSVCPHRALYPHDGIPGRQIVCVSDYRDYLDCQTRWSKQEYERLHGEGSYQKSIDQIINNAEAGEPR